MKTYRFLIAILFMFIMVAELLPNSVTPVRAQSEEGWTAPVNLSNSGAATNPWALVDEKGVIHVFWFDAFDGYKYTNSSDGVKWSEPLIVQMPFAIDKDAPIKPVFLAGANGVIHILWKDSKGGLQYRQSTSSSIGSPSTWTAANTISKSVVAFDAAVDPKGGLHIGFINNIESPEVPAGIYYRRLNGAGWSENKMIYPSKYYRSLKINDTANVQLATSAVNDIVNVYMAWDDRTQKRIFLEKSENGGDKWGDLFQVRGPDDFAGVDMPYNINLGAAENKVLLTWQAGTPGVQCTQYSQWSTDGGKQFGQPVKVLEDFSKCPQSGQFLSSAKDLSVLLFDTLGDLSLMAWDGTQWSKQLTQSDIASFINPTTLDSVIMGCQNITSTKEKIFLVGCDIGQGGDIWFSSRSVGEVKDWFPPPSLWGFPDVITQSPQKITSLLSIADNNNNIHNLWIQNTEDGAQGGMIQYSRWNGQKWSDPATVLSGSDLNLKQPALSLDNQGKLLFAWVDDSTGDMYFTWAQADRANSVSEWQTPIYIPSVSSANSSPDIVTDSSGRMIVAFSVLINEDRGIYIVESEDSGSTWSKPYRVFDPTANNWHMVDRPHIALTGDGRLHILFERYTLWGDERRSNGLYYIQSSDGGVTWSQPEQVSDQPILWSHLASYGKSDLHRTWQEDRASTKVSIDQFSSDGGTTWGTPNTVSTLDAKAVLNNMSMDQFGNLYYLQLTGPDQPSVLDQRWDQSGWKPGTPKPLDIDPKIWALSGISSSVSSDGHLVASILSDAQDPKSKWQDQIISLGQFLEPSKPAPTPYPALIAAMPVASGTQSVAQVSDISTPDSPLSGINNSEPFWLKNKNLIGLFLVVGVLVFFGLFFLVTLRSKGRDKTKIK